MTSGRIEFDPPDFRITMNLTDFHQTLSSTDNPIIVDFWAPWCAPCRTTKPILEKLAQEYIGRVDFLAVNADESAELTGHYRVLAIPTVMSFHDGKLVSRVTGAHNEANYRRFFEAALQGQPAQLPPSTFDRFLRLGAGAALIGVAFMISNPPLAVVGAAIAFLGIYDRCPMLRMVTNIITQRGNNP
jgi:thioredoxin